MPSSALVAAAQASLENLEYEAASSLAEAALRRTDLTLDEQLSAYMTHGVALVVLERPLDAEVPFRLLLRLNLSYEPPAQTPAKAVAVFRKVLVDEQALAARVVARQRAELLATLRLDCPPPGERRGGRQITVTCVLEDPKRAVSGVQLHYRRSGEPDFNALALRKDDELWLGVLPGEWTENQSGATVEYFARTLDREGGELAASAEPGAPQRFDLTAGTVSDARPFYSRPWFWAASAVVVVGLGVTGYLLHERATRLPAHDLGPFEVD